MKSKAKNRATSLITSFSLLLGSVFLFGNYTAVNANAVEIGVSASISANADNTKFTCNANVTAKPNNVPASQWVKQNDGEVIYTYEWYVNNSYKDVSTKTAEIDELGANPGDTIKVKVTATKNGIYNMMDEAYNVVLHRGYLFGNGNYAPGCDQYGYYTWYSGPNGITKHRLVSATNAFLSSGTDKDAPGQSKFTVDNEATALIISLIFGTDEYFRNRQVPLITGSTTYNTLTIDFQVKVAESAMLFCYGDKNVGDRARALAKSYFIDNPNYRSSGMKVHLAESDKYAIIHGSLIPMIEEIVRNGANHLKVRYQYENGHFPSDEFQTQAIGSAEATYTIPETKVTLNLYKGSGVKSFYITDSPYYGSTSARVTKGTKLHTYAEASTGYHLTFYNGTNPDGGNSTWTGCENQGSHNDYWTMPRDRDIYAYACTY